MFDLLIVYLFFDQVSCESSLTCLEFEFDSICFITLWGESEDNKDLIRASCSEILVKTDHNAGKFRNWFEHRI